jgi:hypothetical protein
MRKLLVLFVIAGFFAALVSCSDSKKEEEDDDLYNTPDSNETGDETADEEEQSNDPDEDDVTPVPDEDDVTPVPDEDDVNVPDEDDVNVPDEDDVLDADETGDHDELDDSDHKPVPVECAEGEVGLTIKSFYKDGMDDVDGGGIVNRDPAGTATTDPDATCYIKDTVVTLTVVPDAGFDFLAWKGKNAGKVTGDFPTYSVTLDTFVTLRAQFAPEQ